MRWPFLAWTPLGVLPLYSPLHSSPPSITLLTQHRFGGQDELQSCNRGHVCSGFLSGHAVAKSSVFCLFCVERRLAGLSGIQQGHVGCSRLRPALSDLLSPQPRSLWVSCSPGWGHWQAVEVSTDFPVPFPSPLKNLSSKSFYYETF